MEGVARPAGNFCERLKGGRKEGNFIRLLICNTTGGGVGFFSHGTTKRDADGRPHWRGALVGEDGGRISWNNNVKLAVRDEKKKGTGS